MKKINCFSLLLLSLLTGCYRVATEKNGSQQAYIPIYASEAAIRQVSFTTPQTIRRSGKIVLYHQLLFQVEQDSGIHVFDVSTPASPQRVGFIRSPLCRDLAIRNNYLITNNLDDMVVLDFSNPAAVKEVKRLPGEFPEMRLQHPPQLNVFFECPDPSKGFVVGWKLGTVVNPACRR